MATLIVVIVLGFFAAFLEHGGDSLIAHGIAPENDVELLGAGAVGVAKIHLHTLFGADGLESRRSTICWWAGQLSAPRGSLLQEPMRRRLPSAELLCPSFERDKTADSAALQERYTEGCPAASIQVRTSLAAKASRPVPGARFLACPSSRAAGDGKPPCNGVEQLGQDGQHL